MFLSIIFFPNPISIAITIIGANLPDFDHNIKKISLYKMMIVGLLVFIIIYIMNIYVMKLPYLIGIILCIFPIIFYFSNHRGFTHSLLGIVVLSILLSLFMIMGIDLLSQILNSVNLSNIILFNMATSQLIATVVIVIFLAILIINKRLIFPFLILFLLGLIFFPNGLDLYMATFLRDNINFTIPMLKYIFFPLCLGLLSHIILDSTTPAGIELFRPFSSRRFHLSYTKLLISAFFFIFLYYLYAFYN